MSIDIKTTENISFCDRKADNVKYDDFKSLILSKLKENHGIDISFKPYTLLKHTRLPCVDKHPHLLSLRTIGNNYFLYLTQFDGINYCFYVDRKIDAPRHSYPRILRVHYQFDPSLYESDTLFDGELISDAEKRWYFILSDILVFKGSKLNDKTIERRMELIYYILQNNYKSDMLTDICPFQVKKLFTYHDIQYMINNYIPNLPYHVRGICFNTLNPQYSSYIYMFSQTERIPSKFKKFDTSRQRQRKEMTKTNQKTHTFKIIQTNTSQIYDLYCLNNDKLIKHGVAYIGDASHRQLINDIFDQASSKLNVMVNCYYMNRFRKWKPIGVSTNKNPDELHQIKETINDMS